MTKSNLFVIFNLIVLGTTVNYAVYQDRQINHYRNLLEIEEKRSVINEDQFNEIVLKELKSLGEDAITLAKNQGVNEGILQTINPKNETNSEYGTIWHNGYEQGLEQNKWIAANSYTEGYHIGMEHALRDIGLDHPTYRYASEITSEEDKIKELEISKGTVKAKAITRTENEEFQKQIREYIEKQYNIKNEEKNSDNN